MFFNQTVVWLDRLITIFSFFILKRMIGASIVLITLTMEMDRNVSYLL